MALVAVSVVILDSVALTTGKLQQLKVSESLTDCASDLDTLRRRAADASSAADDAERQRQELNSAIDDMESAQEDVDTYCNLLHDRTLCSMWRTDLESKESDAESERSDFDRRRSDLDDASRLCAGLRDRWSPLAKRPVAHRRSCLVFGQRLKRSAIVS
jgi:hypothetical protein